MRWLASFTDSIDMSLNKLWEILKEKKAWCAVVHGVTEVGHDLVTEQQHPESWKKTGSLPVPLRQED